MKKKFKCICGHVEEVHNFDPDSAFFGCMYTIMIVKPQSDMSPGEPEEDTCRCYEFRPDTLRYVEEVYARRHKYVS